MNTKHTPGTWVQDSIGGTTVWAGNSKAAIAVCQGLERADNIANARLIAAAPELLASLKEIFGLLMECGADEECAEVCAARAAISKATEY